MNVEVKNLLYHHYSKYHSSRKVRCQIKLINQILEEWIGLLKVHQNHWTMDILVLGSMNVTPHSSKQNLESGDLISESGSAVEQLNSSKFKIEQADLMN